MNDDDDDMARSQASWDAHRCFDLDGPVDRLRPQKLRNEST